METTRLSTKDQVILPKTIRLSRTWGPGTEFTVEEAGDAILPRPVGRFPESELDKWSAPFRSKVSQRLARRCAPRSGVR
jgi:bifunctional DNA-binding transcriptional regulator/antitoxin component of YhaV-PrlF toxin-antitoxin module